MIDFFFGQPLNVKRFLPQHQTMRFWGITVGWFGFGVMWFSHMSEAEFAAIKGEGPE